VQYWSLKYYLRMKRRIQIEDELDKIEEQTLTLAGYDRWRELYGNKHLAGVGPNGGTDEQGQTWRPVTDPRQLDEWFNSLAGQRGMTGEQAERMLNGSNNGNTLVGYAQGEGRRV
jgi:hypothetical protein